MQKTRNYTIDFLRAIAALWIVVIHTAFWSGETYLPSWFINLTLLIDVPLFIFISGISFHYSNSVIKSLKGLWIIWKKWCFFLLFYTLIILVFFRSDFHFLDFFSWFFYSFPNSNALNVVSGSIWYIIMYMKVSIFCSITICTIQYFGKENVLKYLKIVLEILFLIFAYQSFSGATFLFFDTYLSFYSILFILGYLAHYYSLKNKKQLILLELIAVSLLCLVFSSLHLDITAFQTTKFPPSFPYLFVSLPSLILCWYLFRHLKIQKENKLNYIGKNAIYFYFMQGISASLLYFILPYLSFENDVMKFGICLFMNLFMTTIGAILLERSYTFFTKKIIPWIQKINFSAIKIKKEL